MPGLFGIVVALSKPSLRLLGIALVLPWLQLAILASAAKVFKMATGEALEHIPIQWLYIEKDKIKHTLVDLFASVVAVSAPLYLLHLYIVRAASDFVQTTQ